MENPEEEPLPKTAEPAHMPQVGNAPLGPRGSIVRPRVMTSPACTKPMGTHWGKQQHLVLVPEESSDHVAWRTLWCRGPDARSWTPGMSEVSTHTKKDK